MDLTMEEKRLFLEKTREIVLDGILNKDDLADIYCVYYRAAERELGKIREGE